MRTDDPSQGDLELGSGLADTATISTRRRVLVYVLLAVIVLIMIGYCLLLVLNEETARNSDIEMLVVIYPFIVGFAALACILYTYMTPYVSEFKIGWTVAIVISALLSLSAFVLPTFWYLQVWQPFRGKNPASAEEGT